MKNAVILITLLFLLTACDNTVDNAVNQNPNSPPPPITFAYSAVGPEVSALLGWQWAKDGTDFIWMFKNDGTVSVIHCCGELFERQFSYLLCGNVFITYGSEEGGDEMEATVFTMTGNGVSFTRDNGKSFTRGETDADSSSASPLALSNDLLGTWRGEDGTEYAFSADAGLLVNSGQYGYLTRYKELLTLGPLVDGETAVLRQYVFNRAGNNLYLRGSDGGKYTLSLVE